MKYLYYNPYEYPNEIKLKSNALNIESVINWNDTPEKIRTIEDLFALQNSNYFEEISINLSSHNEAYYKTKKRSIEKFPVTGWINLKDFINGGGYLNDKY